MSNSNNVALSLTNSTRRARNRRLAAEHQQKQKSSPPRVCSPTSMMMSMSSVHGMSPPASPGSRMNATNGSPMNRHTMMFGHTRPPSAAIITPNSPSRSWDEGDRPPSPKSTSSWKLQPKQQRQPRIVAELNTANAAPTAGSAFNSSKHQPHHPSYAFRRVRSSPARGTEPPRLRTTSSEEDMRSLGSTSATSATTSLSHGSSKQFNNERPPFPSVGPHEEESEPRRQCVSPALSSGSSQSSPANVVKLCEAVENDKDRPLGLSLEEKALWDAIQVARRKARQEGLSAAEQQQLSANYQSHEPENWATRFEEIQEQALSQQRDNSRSLQAIQRVLADVQAERDQAVLQLQEFSSNNSRDIEDTNASAASSINTNYDDKETMQRDLQAMSARIVSLERELQRYKSSEPVVKVTIEQDDETPNTGVDDPSLEQVMDYELTRDSIQQLEREKKLLTQEVECKDKEIQQLEQQLAEVHLRSSINDNDSLDTSASVMSTTNAQLETIRKELAEKTAGLENAKMIIASLENANGSITSDLRQKLKKRCEEIEHLKNEVSDKQKTLDTLATELRDLQKVKAKEKSKDTTEAEQAMRLQLSSRLEANLAEIRAAAVILEATQDPSAVKDLSSLLSDSVSALKEGIDVIENGVDEESSRRDPVRVRIELDEKKKAIRLLEDSLRKEREDADAYRKATQIAQRKCEEEIHGLNAEIRILRQQCNANMEVLTRKERELAVLRDSLRVEDGDVGYISDEDTDDDEMVDTPASPSTAPPNLASDYGPSQAEALATLLAQGGNHSFDSGAGGADTKAISNEQLMRQLEAVKSELLKARTENEKSQRKLKVEKESLSNAKMIISSLERANKSMMEDLRARLQDSNTAIASLLEKSMESEKTNAKLRAELESLKKAQEADYKTVETETALAIPPPTPLLLAETID